MAGWWLCVCCGRGCEEPLGKTPFLGLGMGWRHRKAGWRRLSTRKLFCQISLFCFVCLTIAFFGYRVGIARPRLPWPAYKAPHNARNRSPRSAWHRISYLHSKIFHLWNQTCSNLKYGVFYQLLISDRAIENASLLYSLIFLRRECLVCWHCNLEDWSWSVGQSWVWAWSLMLTKRTSCKREAPSSRPWLSPKHPSSADPTLVRTLPLDQKDSKHLIILAWLATWEDIDLPVELVGY